MRLEYLWSEVRVLVRLQYLWSVVRVLVRKGLSTCEGAPWVLLDRYLVIVSWSPHMFPYSPYRHTCCTQWRLCIRQYCQSFLLLTVFFWIHWCYSQALCISISCFLEFFCASSYFAIATAMLMKMVWRFEDGQVSFALLNFFKRSKIHDFWIENAFPVSILAYHWTSHFKYRYEFERCLLPSSMPRLFQIHRRVVVKLLVENGATLRRVVKFFYSL